MIHRIRNLLDLYLPEPLTIAFCLTIFTMVLGCIIQKVSPVDMVVYWYDGFWGFLTFTLQMAIMLVLGSVIANAQRTQALFARLSAKITTPRMALTFIMVTTAVFTYVNWGVGTLVGPIMTKYLKSRIPGIHLAHLIAASYTSYLIILPMSIGATVPLLVSTPGHFLESEIGIIPFSETIFTPMSMITGVVLFLIIVVFYHVMMPKSQEERHEEVEHEENSSDVIIGVRRDATFAEKLDYSKRLTYLLSMAAFIAVTLVIFNRGLRIDFNMINFLLLFIGIALYGGPILYFKAFSNSIKSVSGIILQFPFYSGIMGMISSSGLIVTITEWVMMFSTSTTFPFQVFVLAGFINFFIPSNGGQWMISGPLLVAAGEGLNIPIGTIINAYTYGTFSTNLLQPFWALPVLALSGLSVKDIWGYCIMSFLLYFIIAGLGMSCLPGTW